MSFSGEHPWKVASAASSSQLHFSAFGRLTHMKNTQTDGNVSLELSYYFQFIFDLYEVD